MPWSVAFKRVPFGLTSGPSAFSVLVAELFQKQAGVSAYIDDIAYGSTSLEAHLDQLDKIMLVAAKYSLTFGHKTHLFKDGLKFLGHYISSKGIQIDDERMTDMLNMAPPTDKAGVLRYRGVIKFLPVISGYRFSGCVSTSFRYFEEVL